MPACSFREVFPVLRQAKMILIFLLSIKWEGRNQLHDPGPQLKKLALGYLIRSQGCRARLTKSNVILLLTAVIRTGLKVSSHSCFQGWLAHGQDLYNSKPDDWVTGLAYKKSGFKSLLCQKQIWDFFCSKPLLCFNLSDLNLGLYMPNAIPQPSGYGIFVLKWKHFY